MIRGFKEYVKTGKKKIITGFITLLLIIVCFYVKAFFFSPYIMEDGRVSAINNKNGSVMIHIKVERNGKSEEKDVLLKFNKKKSQSESKTDEDRIALNTEIDKITGEIERQKGRIIKLPEKGDNGLKIKWSYKVNLKPLFLIILYPLVPFILYISLIEKKKEELKAYRNSIKRNLPKFNHQIILLMNSGLVFSEAFEKIARAYMITADNNNSFEKLISDIYMDSRRGRKSISTVLNEYSRNLSIREFSRMANIVSDHEYKGSDLRSKLSDESRMLWEMRKKDAETEGKKGETKLSFPLSVLLLVLVIITAAPAVIEM